MMFLHEPIKFLGFTIPVLLGGITQIYLGPLYRITIFPFSLNYKHEDFVKERAAFTALQRRKTVLAVAVLMVPLWRNFTAPLAVAQHETDHLSGSQLATSPSDQLICQSEVNREIERIFKYLREEEIHSTNCQPLYRIM